MGLESIYWRTKSSNDRANWIHFVHLVHADRREWEQKYWEATITLHAKDPRRLWAVLNSLLCSHVSGDCSTAPAFSADAFAKHCSNKISSIWADTLGLPPTHRLSILKIFSAEFRSIFLASALKSCKLDPLAHYPSSGLVFQMRQTLSQ